VVFFTSDNGAPPSGDNSGNLPLRGYKADNWEGGIREPAIVRWPGTVAPGSLTYELAATYDIFSTSVAIAGGKLPNDRVIDGKDLRSVLQGGSSGHQCLFHWHNGAKEDGLTAMRCGDYKVHFKTAGRQWSGGSKPANETSWPNGIQDPPLMFNIRIDPSESLQIDPQSAEYNATIAIVSAAKVEHMASLTHVCSQMDSKEDGCGGNDYQYAICKDPQSKEKYPEWPVCTSNPESWIAKTCVR